jgi:TonB family protein
VRANRLPLLVAILIASGSLSAPSFAQAATVTESSAQAQPASAGATVNTVSAKPVRHIGGSVSAPVVISRVPILYDDEASKTNISGSVVVRLQVDEQGNPSNVRLVRGLAPALDKNAVRAVSQYKFKPAMEAGNPVVVEFDLQINVKIAARAMEPYESDRKFIAAIADGKKQTVLGQLNFAIDAYKKANKIAGGKCTDCLEQVIELQIENRSFKDAAATASELAALAMTPIEKSSAERLEGQALYDQGGEKPKPAQLEAANQVLKAAISDDSKNVGAHFCEGTVLARMGQTDAARKQFQECLAQASPSDPSYLRAKHFAENPAMSYLKMAPAFTVTALDGTKFTLDAMAGKVVLIDFWATWCGPCNEELPQMKRIAKEFEGQPLVIISVSWDSDAKKWQDFITKNGMSWYQYRDADHQLTRTFGVDAIPHYFTIGSDGVLTSEMLGSGNDVEGKLRKLVAKAKATQDTVVTATTISPAPVAAN